MSIKKSNPKSPFTSPLIRLPQALRKKLRAAPATGEGVHNWIFGMSLALHRHLKPDEIETLLAAAVRNCGREVPHREIGDAVANSLVLLNGGLESGNSSGKGKENRKGAVSATKKWPPVDCGRRSGIISSSPVTLASLGAASPMPIDPDENVNLYLHLLYRPGDLLCVARSKEEFRTLPFSTLLNMIFGDICLIVPSPMTAEYGRTQDGRRSQHTLSNTGPRRYLITEFDSGTFDEHAKIITHLRESMPLCMVLHSGGKSLHAWWPCEGRSGEQLLEFFRYAVTLGADPATWSRAQFVRLPQGWREDSQATQTVHYFDEACRAEDETSNLTKEGQQ